jgi:hypothetical protein
MEFGALPGEDIGDPTVGVDEMYASGDVLRALYGRGVQRY